MFFKCKTLFRQSHPYRRQDKPSPEHHVYLHYNMPHVADHRKFQDHYTFPQVYFVVSRQNIYTADVIRNMARNASKHWAIFDVFKESLVAIQLAP